MEPKSYWLRMDVFRPRNQEAVHSYIDPLANGWEVLKCDILEDAKTEITKKLRALVRSPDGSVKEVIRTFGRTYTLTMRSPSRAIMKGFRIPERSVAPVAEVQP